MRKSCYYNKRILEFIGRTHEEALAMDWDAFVHPQDLWEFGEAYFQAVYDRKNFEWEYRFLRADGQYIWHMSAGAPRYSSSGEYMGYIASAFNIHDRKMAEEALRESEQRFRSMADASPIMIWLLEPTGRLTYVNTKALEFAGDDLEAVLNRDWREYIHPRDYEPLVEEMARAIAAEETFEFEFRCKRWDGAYRWLLLDGSPGKDSAGNLLGFVGSAVDITDRKEAEETLTRAKDEAESASLKKSEFLSLMSHELRTPLNAIIGYSEMLESGLGGQLNEKQFKYAHNVSASGCHLLDIVNDILDVSKLEAGMMELNVETFEIAPLLERIQAMMRELAYNRSVSLSFHVQPGVEYMSADAHRLRQILINLIGNAIKFNREGGTAEVYLGRDKGGRWYVFEVRDSGMGIPQDKVSRLFTKFYQVDSSHARGNEGTGLGLALTKQLVELHGGSISVESEEGVGSTFRFTLPAR